MKKATQGSRWVSAGVGFDIGFHFKPNRRWVSFQTQRLLGLSSRWVPASEALGSVLNPAVVGSKNPLSSIC
ncbi:hypothetical protein SLEP1_g1550 [Rubroshorea leprosula]|uniref:Uncharacterized protein n=1 Tax=Rubroshorea leprosula TaxID=152421 RepID=A0AAV5HPK4_9ROSI|nr:hypothetical protein SLEP1_g1550 [Rubroshorea leprosula]